MSITTEKNVNTYILKFYFLQSTYILYVKCIKKIDAKLL